jgi:hypothetical protein
MNGTPATRAPKPKAIAMLAPSAPPPDTPNVKGSASGLRNSACSEAPTIASDAPTIPAINTRGRRKRKKSRRAISSLRKSANAIGA